MYLYKNDIGYNRWGLDRINQHNNILDDIYHNRNTGDGIEVYIIDSGIETTHEILKHNSQMIKDFTKDNDMIDYNGHGTHVAGIIGGLYYGVASNVKIYGIKVFDATGVGSTITIIEAMYEVLKRCSNKKKKCVVNMSLGGIYQQIYNDIIKDMMMNNIVVVVAAGNSNDNACNYTPAAAYFAVTVGATDLNDNKAYFSNYGNCVNIYAPGHNIISSYLNNSYKYLSGTSMATPFVTGVISHMWSKNKEMNSYEIVDELYKKSNIILQNYKIYKYEINKTNTEFINKTEKFLYINNQGYTLSEIIRYDKVEYYYNLLNLLITLYYTFNHIKNYLFY